MALATLVSLSILGSWTLSIPLAVSEGLRRSFCSLVVGTERGGGAPLALLAGGGELPGAAVLMSRRFLGMGLSGQKGGEVGISN